MPNTNYPFRKFLSKLKRQIIGGCWVKHNDCREYFFCKKHYDGGNWSGTLSHWDGQRYCGYHKSLLSIESLEDYGNVSKIGKFLGYSNDSVKRQYGIVIPEDLIFWITFFGLLFYLLLKMCEVHHV